MGVLARAFAPPERRTDDTPLLQWARGALVSIAGTTGRIVTEQTALSVGPVYACVRILAETLASMPLDLYERTPTGRVKAVERPLYWMLHDLPNPEITSFEFREALMGHLVLWGNAYAEIQRNDAREIIGLWPLLPNRMQRIDRDDTGRLCYFYRAPDGKAIVLKGPFGKEPSDILHLRGLAFDGIRGYSPMRLLRDAVGLTQAAEEYGSRFFGNSARPSGVLQAKGKLTDLQINRLKSSWEDAHRGLTQAHRTAILEEGITWQQIGINPNDAQFLDTRTFQVREIARIFRISPHLLQDLERATFANIEQLSIEFVHYTMKPWMRRWEQAIMRDLISIREFQTQVALFDPNELLRGDFKSTVAAFAQGIQWGIYSPDDARTDLGQNPRADGAGGKYLTPMNMVVGPAIATPPSLTPAPLDNLEEPTRPASAGPDDIGSQVFT